MFHPMDKMVSERETDCLHNESCSMWLGPSKLKQLGCGLGTKLRVIFSRCESPKRDSVEFRRRYILTLMFVRKEPKLGLQMVPCRHK